MSETVIDTTIGSGNSATGTFGKSRGNDTAILVVDGDADATDLTVDVTGVNLEPNGTPVPTNISSSVSNFDASGDYVAQLTGLERVGLVEVTATNNGANASSVLISNPEH